MIESRFRHALTRRLSRYSLLAAAVLPSASWAATFSPTTSTQFQTDLNNCARGDTIILQAGTIYQGTFTLPNKSSGSGYVTIRSSAVSSLPAAGTRVNLTHASLMPRIRAADANGAAIQTATSAHHYHLIGLEVTGPTVNTQPDGISNITWAPIELGTSGTAQDTLTEVPNNIIIERCIVRANSNQQRIKRGIGLNSASTDIKDCYIADFKAVGQDAQALGGYNGPGPFNIINNFIEGSTENLLFGGTDPTIPNLVPSDIVIQKNHFYKPLTWKIGDPSYGGTNWSVKNIFELKNSRNVLVEGNIIERCWVMGQTGEAVVLTPRNQDDTAPWCVVEDVIFRKNIVRDAVEGVNILAIDDEGQPSQQTNNITFEHNLFYNLSGKWFKIPGGNIDTLTVNHNTAFFDSQIATTDTTPNVNFTYTNNIAPHALYGFHSPTHTINESTLDFYYPSATWAKNVILHNSTSDFLPNYHGGWSPTSLGYPSTWSGVLVNQASPGSNFAGWKVVTGSAYDNGASDGTDVGCDIDALNAATAGCISGVWPGGGGGGGTTTITLKNGVNSYTGATSFMTWGNNPTTHYGASMYHTDVNDLSGTNFYGVRSFYKFDLNQGANAIPSGATIQSASLKVKVEWSNNPSDRTMRIHRVSPVGGFTVNYATATRNTYNGTNSWTGGSNAAGDVANSNNDFLDTPDSTALLPASGAAGDLIFDVKSSVQAWVNGTSNNGWLILSSPVTTNVYMGTPADLHGSAEYPELTITYSTSAPSTTVTMKNGVSGYNGSTSFMTWGNNPTTHYGPSMYHTDVNQLSGTNFYAVRSFFKFDVSSIPSGKTIDSATLKVKVEYSNNPANRTMSIHRVSPASAFTVNYATATRNTYNGSNSWTGGNNAGGDVANSNNDFLDTPDSTALLPAGGIAGDMIFDVKSSVQAWVNGTANNGWLILTSPDITSVYMGTPADLHGSADYPELTVTYH